MPATRKNKTITLIGLCLLTGTLDAIAALLISYKVSPSIIFKFIASGWFGKTAFAGGTEMVIWGIFFHYLIAAIFSISLFVLYPVAIGILKNKYVTGVIYGLIIWAAMNLVVLPQTHIPQRPIQVNWGLAEGIAALIICVGLPVAIIANRYYKKY